MEAKSRAKRAILGLTAALTLAGMAAPSHATTVIIAGFDTGASAARNFRFVNQGPADSDSALLYTTSTATATSPGAAAVRFSFFNDPTLPDFLDLTSAFTFNATVKDTPASFDGATYTQTGINGAFKFVYTGTTKTLDGISLVKNSTVLFSGTFTDAWIQGRGGVGGIDVSIANGGAATFSSSIYDLANFDPKSEEFSFHLGNVSPAFTRANKTSALSSFRAHVAGEFQADAVPEPASWALMITGFGAAGAMLRRRRRLALAL